MEVEEIEPDFIRLNNLKDVATLISNVCNFIGDSFYFFLQISYVVGSFIVDQILNFTNYFIKFLELVNITLSILYEDSLVFFQDLGEKCIFIFGFCIQGVEALITGLINGVYSIGDGVMEIGVFINYIINFFYSTLLAVISFCKDAANLTKQMLILFGSSVWLCVTFIPTVVIASYNLFVQSVCAFINKSQNFILTVLDTISSGLHDLIEFFFDLPVNSGAGIVLGLLLLVIIFISFDKICALISQSLNKICSSLISFSSNLWSGKFLENKSKNDMNNGNVYNDLSDDKLCIVCQENPKEIIYLPCGHFCLCKECSNQIRKTHKTCPVCRKQVKKTSKVYT